MLGFEDNTPAKEILRAVFSDPAASKRARDLRICLVGYDAFNKVNVRNLYGSQVIEGDAYIGGEGRRGASIAGWRGKKCMGGGCPCCLYQAVMFHDHQSPHLTLRPTEL